MTNPVVQTDIAEILSEVRQELRGINDRLGKLEVGQAEIRGDIKSVDERLGGQIKNVDEKLSGQIRNVDEKLSGQIKTLDEKVSGQKEALDTKSDQLEKRISNQERSGSLDLKSRACLTAHSAFFNRIIGGSLVVSILGGIAGFSQMASKIQ
jgi:chromosome segregation ATPase